MSQRSRRITERKSVLALQCLLFLLIVSLVGCGAGQTPSPSLPSATVPSLPTREPTSTLTPLPTATNTPRPTATPTPAPTATPLHPMSIAYMRQESYPGSDLVIEETLSPGGNYDRYVASYQSEGLKIYGLLTVPRGERPESGWPIIVFNHGYIPPSEYRTAERYYAYQDGFARNGYITLKPDFRGHGDSEGLANGGSRGPDYTIDALNAVSSLQRYPDADPERVGMWGHSMGGAIVLRSMVVTDDVKAGVIWAGVVATYQELFESRPRWMGAEPSPTPGPDGTAVPQPQRGGLFRYGTFEENPAFWAAIDPVTYLTDLSGPIQLHHATGDQSVPVAFSENLYERLQAVDQTAELYVYEGDNHNLSANFSTAMQRSVAFFDEHVKGAGGE